MTTQPEDLSRSAALADLDTEMREASPSGAGDGTPPDLPDLETGTETEAYSADGGLPAENAADPDAVIDSFLDGQSGGSLKDLLEGAAAEIVADMAESPEFADEWEADSRQRASR